MTNKSKQKGTRAESRVVKYLESHGIMAQRKALHGNKDEGDIELPGLDICLEVKAGKQTANYTRGKLTEWLYQSVMEERNSGQACFLVIVRFNKSINDAEVWYQGGTNGGRVMKYLDEFCEMLNTPSSKR